MMRINFLMFIIALSFFTVIGLLVGEHLYNLKMAEAGLEECVVAVDSNTYEAVWQKDCPK